MISAGATFLKRSRVCLSHATAKHDSAGSEKSLLEPMLCRFCARVYRWSRIGSFTLKSDTRKSANRSLSSVCPPLDIESAYSHVCHAGIAVRLSGCVVCADSSDAGGCDGFGVQSCNDSSQRV